MKLVCFRSARRIKTWQLFSGRWRRICIERLRTTLRWCLNEIILSTQALWINCKFITTLKKLTRRSSGWKLLRRCSSRKQLCSRRMKLRRKLMRWSAQSFLTNRTWNTSKNCRSNQLTNSFTISAMSIWGRSKIWILLSTLSLNFTMAFTGTSGGWSLTSWTTIRLRGAN